MGHYDQELITFAEAGYNAFRMAFSTGHFGAPLHRPYRIDNPYTKRPFNKLWRRGWDEAQREFEMGPPFSNFRYKPFENHARIQEFVRQVEQRERFKNRKATATVQKATQGSSFQKPFPRTFNTAKPKWSGKPLHGSVPSTSNRVAPAPSRPAVPEPVNFKRIENFNQKHRTTV